ncbi:hypothetical protein LCGC14_3027810, partial [marine sediment metagenome]
VDVNEQDVNHSLAMSRLALTSINTNEQDANFSGAMSNLSTGQVDISIDTANQTGNLRVDVLNTVVADVSINEVNNVAIATGNGDNNTETIRVNIADDCKILEEIRDNAVLRATFDDFNQYSFYNWDNETLGPTTGQNVLYSNTDDNGIVYTTNPGISTLGGMRTDSASSSGINYIWSNFALPERALITWQIYFPATDVLPTAVQLSWGEKHGQNPGELNDLKIHGNCMQWTNVGNFTGSSFIRIVYQATAGDSVTIDQGSFNGEDQLDGTGPSGFNLNQNLIGNNSFNFAMLRSFTEDNQETIIKFLRAIDKATIFVKNNKKESQNVITKRLNLEKEAAALHWDEFVFEISLGQSLMIGL